MKGEAGNSSDAILGFADRLRDSRRAQPEQRRTFESWVVFRVSNRSLALPVSHVREILRLAELTEVPNAPKPVAGVMNLRGHVLPVLDTYALLDLPTTSATASSRVLVCLIEERPIGLIVDDVSGLERLQVELVQAVAADDPLARISQGAFPRDDQEALLLLDPARLFLQRASAFN